VVGEECDLTMQQVFKPDPGGRKPVVRDEARAFLAGEKVRHDGRVPIRTAKKKFEDLGSYDTLKRAASEMGLKTEHDDVLGGWVWCEPDGPPRLAKS
jgi:hypothetical protein